jgi:O-methyltransferase involved in polyketide biosynthesis
MSKIRLTSQNVVAETLLMPLYARALEAQYPAPLLRDDKAVALVRQIDYDFSRFKLRGHDQATIIMRMGEFDRQARGFLARHPEAVVVHIGCGLDTRFDRVDNGQVEWYDLDLPEVINLRRSLMDETPRCRLIGCSVFDSAWLDVVSIHAGRPFLFLAEGVLPYFEEAQVKDLVLLFKERFPGAELVCDAMTPFMVRSLNLELAFTRLAARLHWGLKRGRDLESWGAGIRLLDEWFYFDRPEPRLGASQLMRYIPPLAKGVGIFHYQLGGAERGQACTGQGVFSSRGVPGTAGAQHG